MRIGVDATILEDNKPSGMACFAANVVNELVKLHNDIAVWVINSDLLDVPEEKVRRVMIPFSSGSGLLPWIRMLWTQFFLPRLLVKEKVDVFFSPIPEGMLNPPVPQVLVVHDLVPLMWPEDAPLLRRISFRSRVPLALKASAQVVAVSNATKRDLVKTFEVNEKKISVIYEGFNSDYFAFRDEKNAQVVLDKYGLEYGKYFLFVGNFTPRKNIHAIVKAFAQVVRTHSNICLVLAGNTDFNKSYYKYVRGVIDRLGLSKRVIVLDYVSFGDLPCLYSGARALVFPSWYEGFGLPMLEAIACGTWVLTFKNSALEEIGGKLFLGWCNTDNLDEMMLDLIFNEERVHLACRLGEGGLQRFSWRETALRILKVLKNTALVGR